MRWQRPLRRKPAGIVGYIEHVDARLIRGWAWNPSKPTGRLCLEVFVGGIYAGRARTGQFREDLRANRVGDGCHAFVFHLPHHLRGCATTLHEVEVLTNEMRPRRLGKVDAGKIVSDSSVWPGEPTASVFFKPLVEQLNARASDSPRTKADNRRQIDQLLSSRAPGEPSAFVTHITRKYLRPKPAIDDPDAWAWYVGAYGLEKGPARVPLSPRDLETLLEVRERLQRTPSLFSPISNSPWASYDWVIDQARRLFLEDCLVTPNERAQLSRVRWWHRRTAFPLSRFMRRFASEWAFQRCDTKAIEGRVKVYTLIMLFALQDAHYLAYLPVRWLKQMLAEDDCESRFERSQIELFGAAIKPADYRRHAVSLGFDIETQNFDGTSYRHGRVCHGSDVLVDPPQVDVQLIGPFRRSLGLAESCRRLAVALQTAEFTLNLCDFDIGQASGSAEPSMPLGDICPARINILHINAEEVPEAIAYLPDSFSRSHTILMPYWELDRPASQHVLGLAIVDEIWAATHYLADVFARRDKAVTWVGMGADDRPRPTRDQGRALISSLSIPHKPFIFLTTSDALSWPQRKNPLGVIDAFQAAFAGFEAALIVKTRHASLSSLESQKVYWQTVRGRCEDDPRIFLVDRDLSDADQRALLAGCDCLLSLHRAEGLGLDLLDAMASGTPVVATAYSGNMDYCDQETAWLVDFDLRTVKADEYAFAEPGHVWAEPRYDSAVAALRSVLHDEQNRRAKIECAASKLRSDWSPTRFSSRTANEIEGRLEAMTQRQAGLAVA